MSDGKTNTSVGWIMLREGDYRIYIAPDEGEEMIGAQSFASPEEVEAAAQIYFNRLGIDMGSFGECDCPDHIRMKYQKH